jgi:hypothetical protein
VDTFHATERSSLRRIGCNVARQANVGTWEILPSWHAHVQDRRDEAAYIPRPGDQAAAWRIAAGFRELREDDFAGGFVIRRLKPFGSAEVRTWWTASTCRLVTAHPDAPGDQPPPDLDLMPFIRLIGSLGLEFLTADLARRADRT